MIQLSDDRYEFFLHVLFGSEKNPYVSSSKAAYRDLCRTLRFGAPGGKLYRQCVDSILEKRIREILNHGSPAQNDYDEWHHSVCRELVAYYSANGIPFTVGHAQKWLNMTMKYLYIRAHPNIDSVLLHLHVPLDQYILRAVDRELGITPHCSAWSKMDSYETYIGYQNKIREKVHGIPLLWEIWTWLKELSYLKLDNAAPEREPT